MSLFEILWAGRIDESTQSHRDIAGANLRLGEIVASGAIIDLKVIVVFIDNLHGHEALAGVGQRDHNRSGVKVKHRGRIKRVAVKTDNSLIVDRCRLAAVNEISKGALFDDLAQI